MSDAPKRMDHERIADIERRVAYCEQRVAASPTYPAGVVECRNLIGDARCLFQHCAAVEAELAEAKTRVAELELVVTLAMEYRRRERTGGGCDIETTVRLQDRVDAAREALDAALGCGEEKK